MNNVTVFVGMSGGVDSSVTASLLKDEGYDVRGVYMKNWARDLPGFECPWREDLADAKRVAVQLGVPFEVFDFEAEYQDKVVEYLIDGYKKGLTPNPDIMCNQEIKFKVFLDRCLDAGADSIATGHYARIEEGRLFKGVDESKDQSYFLYRMPKVALSKTLMPLGKMEKSRVREIAREKGLITADKKDSMGICFVGKVGIKDFLKAFVETEAGPIKNNNDEIVGEHDGALFYTIGQRHGLNIGGGLPYYVSGKDMDSNTVFVTNDLNNKSLWVKQLRLAEQHWLVDDLPEALEVRTRHMGELNKANLVNGNPVIIKLDNEIRSVTAGQSAVLYKDDLVLGGGVII